MLKKLKCIILGHHWKLYGKGNIAADGVIQQRGDVYQCRRCQLIDFRKEDVQGDE